MTVGFATRLAPHNLRSVVKAMRLLAENKKAQALKELKPDFPTGCDVVDDEGMEEYMATGHGSIAWLSRRWQVHLLPDTPLHDVREALLRHN